MQDCPSDLSYSVNHVWVRLDEDSEVGTVGITDELVERVGHIDSIDMPMTGDELEMDEFCLHIHTGGVLHHVRSPLSGRVTETDSIVEDRPHLLHVSPFENWLFKMEIDDITEAELLMDYQQYAKFLDTL